MKTKLILLFMMNAIIALANTFTVTNTNDAGTGSLREALTNANYYPGSGHTIQFNIPTSDPGYNSSLGVWMIQPSTVFPYITKSGLTIDGTTQTGYAGNTNPNGPEIMLDGNGNTIDFGFFVFNASNVTIKGFIISDFLYGIQIFGPQSQNNNVLGNYIGLTAHGNDTLGNFIGVEIFGGAKFNTVGGSDAVSRNVVSGNEHIGIRVFDATDNYIKGNYVGVDRTGSFAKGNYDGISIEGTAKRNIIGGSTAGEGNLVSGNVAYGIPIFGAGCDSNIVIGNIVGLDVTGSYAISNTYGLLFDDGARYNRVGGFASGERNVFSGNSGYGLFLYNMGTCCNDVIGNYIGTDITGTIAVPNANGITIDGVATNHYIGYNVISGNLQQGIVIHITGTDGHYIEKNYIGTDASGNNPMPNGFDGIRLAEGVKHNVIIENDIAWNGRNGIQVMNENDDYNTITRNSIHDNAGYGIELLPPGVNVNDAGDTDTGPNQGMNYPVINSAEYENSTGYLFVSGTLDTQLPQYCTVEIFKAESDTCNHGEGQVFIDTLMPDASGNFSGWIYTDFNITSGDKITATATDSSGNTSEFSLNKIISPYVGINPSAISQQTFSAFPNPFRNTLTISFSLSETSETGIAVFNICGQKICIIEKEKRPEGEYSINWNSKDLPAGSYILELKIDNKISVIKPIEKIK
ncbi:MAG: right-handed parallel beta-helix repeat-containing protein [Bacteroidia bacterium]|nr:right-handed parallel beta-helix repeat-containing protein [Bacteroidia bacterium]